MIERLRAAGTAVDALLADAVRQVRQRVMVEDRTVGKLLDREQRSSHGLAWLATYAESIRQLTSYAERMTEQGLFGEIEEILVRIGVGEYLAQIVGGIPMSQGEMVRPSDFGLTPAQVSARMVPVVHTLVLVEHDMDVVFQLAHRITVLVNGAVLASGTPAAMREDNAVRSAYLGYDG